MHNILYLNTTLVVHGIVHNTERTTPDVVKTRHTEYLGTVGFDTALMAGPYTPWPDMGWFWNNFPNNASSAQFYNVSATDTVEFSSGHPYQKLGHTTRDIGGDFAMRRYEYDQSPGNVSYDISKSSNPSASGYHYRGPQFAAYHDTSSQGAWLDPEPSSFLELRALGTTAIARCIPTNPLFDLTTFIGELHEGIPRLVGADFFKNRTAYAKSAGSEYLNLQFGWLPLYSDVQKFAYAVKNQDEVLAQYERDSGKRLKRRITILEERTTESYAWNGASAKPTPALPTTCSPDGFASVALRQIREITRRQWFSGCFTYYLEPERSGVKGRKRWLQEANKLYGVRLTPETLWNLTPWSWGVDWFSNVGDVLHNASAFANDGLVMPYGYMMEQCSIKDHYTNSGAQYKSPGIPSTYTQTFTTYTKRRVKATPFGFGIDLSSLTGRQLAIVSALGLSRSGSVFT
jgi:hypothetical protein